MKSFAIGLAFALCAVPAAAPALAAPVTRTANDDAQTQASTRNLYLTLIRQARADGHARAALAFLDDFERDYPGDVDALVLRVNCLLDLDQTAAAQEAAAKLPIRNPDGAVHAARGHVFAALGEWAEAIGEYNLALATTPSDSLANNALGYAQVRSGRVDEAIETLKRARELDPQDLVIRNNLLLALTIGGRKNEADDLLARSGDDGFQTDLRRQVSDEAVRLAVLPGAKVAQP